MSDDKLDLWMTLLEARSILNAPHAMEILLLVGQPATAASMLKSVGALAAQAMGITPKHLTSDDFMSERSLKAALPPASARKTATLWLVDLTSVNEASLRRSAVSHNIAEAYGRGGIVAIVGISPEGYAALETPLLSRAVAVPLDPGLTLEAKSATLAVEPGARPPLSKK